MIYHKLNQDQVADLIDRRLAGEPAAVLAKEFGVCRATVHNYLHRAGVEQTTDFAPKLNEQQREDLLNGFQNGESVASLARRFEISHSAATKLIVRRTGRNPGRQIREIHVFPPTDPMELAYLAAMIDAEGCITRNSKVAACTWQVVITNTSAELRKWLEQFGGVVYDLGRSRSETAREGVEEAIRMESRFGLECVSIAESRQALSEDQDRSRGGGNGRYRKSFWGSASSSGCGGTSCCRTDF